MPSKFRLKTYKSGGIYHIYNIGIDSRAIFLDDDDYNVFLDVLKRYLLLEEESTPIGFKQDKPSIYKRKQSMKLNHEVSLLAFCLMQNHFHLLLRQQTEDGIVKFMRRVCTYYSMYFNKKYKRRGNLFEGVYRAVLIEDGMKLLHLSRYIHLNPVAKSVKRFGLVETVVGIPPEQYIYSSLGVYMGLRKMEMIDMSPVMEQLKGGNYGSFLRGVDESKSSGIVEGITIDH
jgi:REP element-mobilizing transposase RayT